MEVSRVRLSGLTRYTRPIDLDLSDLPEGLVAVTGTNGAGKSTILEAMVPGALFRSLPTYGAALSCATARDAFLDVEFAFGGAAWRAVHKFDAAVGLRSAPTSSAYLFRDGEELTDGSGRVNVFDDVVAAWFPPIAIWLASCFRVQDNAGDFAVLPAAQRRDLFVDMLGLGKLRELAARAVDRRKVADRALVRMEQAAERLAVDRAAAERLAADLVVADADVVPLAADVDRLVQAARDAEAREAAARAAADVANQGRADALRARDEAQVAAVEAADESARAKTRAANLERLAAGLDGARTRAARLAAARAAQADAQAAAGAASARQAATVAAAARATAGHVEAVRRLAAARRELDEFGDLAAAARAAALLDADAAGLDDLVAAEAAARQASTAAATAYTSAKASLESDLRAARAARDQADRDLARAKASRAKVDAVPCHGRKITGRTDGHPPAYAAVYDCASCDLIRDAVRDADQVAALQAAATSTAAALDALTAGDAVPALADAAAAAAERLTAASVAVTKARQSSTRAAEQRRRVERGQAVARQAATLAADVERLAAELAAATADRDEAVDGHRAAVQAREAADDVAAELDGAERLVADAEAAARDLVDARADVVRLVQAAARARLRADEVVVPPGDDEADALAAAAALDASTARAELDTARARLDAARDHAAGLRGALAARGDVAARAAELDAARAALSTRRAGLRLAEQALGRNGVQALAIDAAAVQVGDTVTDLLRRSFGGRFAVSLTTTAPKRGGGLVEVFDVLVHDGERPGGPRPLERTSGGERALIGVAFRLAVAAVNARRTGAPFRSLFLDEADRALSPDNRARYPAIVRAAMEAGGFRRAFLITHDPGIMDQADAVIRCADGDVRVVRVSG